MLLNVGLQTARQVLYQRAEVPQELVGQQPTRLNRAVQPLIELQKIRIRTTRRRTGIEVGGMFQVHNANVRMVVRLRCRQ